MREKEYSSKPREKGNNKRRKELTKPKKRKGGDKKKKAGMKRRSETQGGFTCLRTWVQLHDKLVNDAVNAREPSFAVHLLAGGG